MAIDRLTHLEDVRDLCHKVADMCEEMTNAVVAYRDAPMESSYRLHPTGTSLSGALRRRSMDLTRALAELRRRE